MTAKVTPLMATKYAEALEHGGKLVRWNTGASSVWSYPNVPLVAHGTRRKPSWYIGDSTMRALVAHGYARWTAIRPSGVYYMAELIEDGVCHPNRTPKKPPATTRIES